MPSGFKNERVDTRFIKVQKDKETNYHYVLWFDKDRTILVNISHLFINFQT